MTLPNPTRPKARFVTHSGDIRQLGWILDVLPGAPVLGQVVADDGEACGVPDVAVDHAGYSGLGARGRGNLVAVDLSFYTSPLSEEIRDEGRAQRGAEDVLLVLGVRGIEISDGTREKVTACTDPKLLSQWLVRAAVAATGDEVFGEEQTSADR